MKVLLKKLMLFLVLALLIGTVGSEAYAYGEFYTVAGSHKGHVRRAPVVSRPATKVAPRPAPYKPSRVANYIDIDVWVTQVPVRRRYIYSNYYGYYRWNLSGRNYLRKWLGDHHHRHRHRHRH